jgi:hypothetical protein
VLRIWSPSDSTELLLGEVRPNDKVRIPHLAQFGSGMLQVHKGLGSLCLSIINFPLHFPESSGREAFGADLRRQAPRG